MMNWRRKACLEAVARAAARYVASHRCQAVRIQDATDAAEYDAASKALDAALSELGDDGWVDEVEWYDIEKPTVLTVVKDEDP